MACYQNNRGIVWLYQEKKEKLLNSQFRKTIPHSTISTWRNNPSKLYGEEYSQEFREYLLQICAFIGVQAKVGKRKK